MRAKGRPSAECYRAAGGGATAQNARRGGVYKPPAHAQNERSERRFAINPQHPAMAQKVPGRQPEKPAAAAPKKKKKKMTAAEMHRKLQDNVQMLPHAVTHLEKEGKKTQAFIVKYVSGPVMKLINRVMNSQRYKGAEGARLKQSEQMKRHLEQRQQAMDFMRGEMQKMQKRQQKRGGGGKPR